MKKSILGGIAVIFGACVFAFAAIETIESPVAAYSDPVSVSISTYAYTNATPSSVRISALTTIWVDVPATNTANMFGHIGNCTSTSISTSTVLGPIEIDKDSDGQTMQMAQDTCLWMISLHTAAEDITVQGTSQFRR